MNALIITVAGISSRFGKSLGREALKCIYSEGGIENSLLHRLLDLSSSFDRIVIVGGYRFGELEEYISHVSDNNINLKDKPVLVYNSHFEDRGSGWSFYLAIETLRGDLPDLDSIVFAEGDLYFDKESFDLVYKSNRDVLTSNTHVIDASKSVAFYCDRDFRPHYIYDTSHGLISVSEPFTRIYNSGQVWKFANPVKLLDLSKDMPKSLHSQTNLELINRYFSVGSIDDLDVVEFKEWINCNTVDDYRRAFGN